MCASVSVFGAYDVHSVKCVSVCLYVWESDINMQRTKTVNMCDVCVCVLSKQ